MQYWPYRVGADLKGAIQCHIPGGVGALCRDAAALEVCWCLAQTLLVVSGGSLFGGASWAEQIGWICFSEEHQVLARLTGNGQKVTGQY